MKLILLRHGESEWNLQNRFTGWKDVSLTSTGIEEANFAGQQLLKINPKITSIDTSILKRAIHTTDIVTDIINFPKNKINYHWRLNERHYGALQGLNKSDTALKYGEDQVKIWRRSYNIPPPLLEINDERHPRFSKRFSNISSENLPVGESLMNVIERLQPFWNEYINNVIKSEESHLIVAHSNSLRAIVKVLDQLSDEEIISVNIPTGVPLVYTLDHDLVTISNEYLLGEKELKEKQEIVMNQGKAKWS